MVDCSHDSICSFVATTERTEELEVPMFCFVAYMIKVSLKVTDVWPIIDAFEIANFSSTFVCTADLEIEILQSYSVVVG